MCVLSHKPAGATVHAGLIRRLAERNGDGIGFATATPEGIVLWRSLADKRDDVDTAAKLIEATTDVPALIHLRLATHGTKTVENVHPFFLPDRADLVYAHNGIIQQMPRDTARSDTRMFGEHLLAHLRDGWWNDEHTVTALESLIGHNKVALMRADGERLSRVERDGEYRRVAALTGDYLAFVGGGKCVRCACYVGLGRATNDI